MATFAPVALASTPSHTTFSDVIGKSRLVVLIAIDAHPDGGFTFYVQRALKGIAPAQLVYPPLGPTPPFDGWSRAVIAFADPATDDFRAPTIAWHVTSDGTIDPGHYQRYPGLPLTLGAMFRYFDVPSTDASGPADPATTGSTNTGLGFLVLAAVAGLLFGTHRFGRRASSPFDATL